MEKDTMLFYHGLRDFAGPREREVLGSITREEKKHLLQVSRLLNDLVGRSKKPA